MFESKTILASRTIWSNLIGLSALVQFIAAGSFIASTVLRIVTTKQILNDKDF